jgi:hypothetical protein
MRMSWIFALLSSRCVFGINLLSFPLKISKKSKVNLLLLLSRICSSSEEEMAEIYTLRGDFYKAYDLLFSGNTKSKRVDTIYIREKFLGGLTIT